MSVLFKKIILSVFLISFTDLSTSFALECHPNMIDPSIKTDYTLNEQLYEGEDALLLISKLPQNYSTHHEVENYPSYFYPDVKLLESWSHNIKVLERDVGSNLRSYLKMKTYCERSFLYNTVKCIQSCEYEIIDFSVKWD